jgi:DNA-binding SARP family transcriptional activator
MSGLKATLFGKFSIQRDSLDMQGIEARKAQELLGYLLVFRNHVHARELLSETLWGEQSSTNSRKYLRQALWRIQSALRLNGDRSELELVINNDWIQIKISSRFWLDVEEFEKVFDLVKGRTIHELNLRHLKMLKYAVSLYKGDLLEGCYEDWCIFERERFQTMHLLLLDKLVQYSELYHTYDSGLAYGIEVLRHDPAYERAHRQLMRLYVMSGNRSQALHQYERCVLVLQEELGVEPSERTKQLYDQIRSDCFRPAFPAPTAEGKPIVKTKVRGTPALSDVLHRLEEVSETLNRLEHRIEHELAGLRNEGTSQH